MGRLCPLPLSRQEGKLQAPWEFFLGSQGVGVGRSFQKHICTRGEKAEGNKGFKKYFRNPSRLVLTDLVMAVPKELGGWLGVPTPVQAISGHIVYRE